MPYWIKIPSLLILALLPLCFMLGGYIVLGNIKSQSRVCTKGQERFIVNQEISEVNANGLAWADYDNDGWDDLLIGSYPRNFNEDIKSYRPLKIYKNIKGQLTDFTNFILKQPIHAKSGVFADYDNDGWQDLFLLEGAINYKAASFNQGFYLRPRVFHNMGGKMFEDVTDTVGLSSVIGKGSRGSYAFADFDADGDLDFALVMRGYIQVVSGFQPKGSLLRPHKIFGTLGRERIACGKDAVESVLSEEPRLASEVERSFGSREAFVEKQGCIYDEITPAFDPIQPFWELNTNGTVFLVIPGEIRMFRNDKRKFVNASTIVPPYRDYPEGFFDAAPSVPWKYVSYKLRQPIIVNVNSDNLPDIFVVSEGGRSLILQNEGNFHFRDVSTEHKINVFGAGRGIAQADLLHKGKLDLVMGNRGNAFFFMRNNDSLQFNPKIALNRFGLGEGVVSIDSDNDGWPDLVMANGREDPKKTKISKSFFNSLLHPVTFVESRFYYNKNGEFLDHTGELCLDAIDTYSIAVSDFNNDGYDDFAIGTLNDLGNKGTGVFLLRNTGGQNHFVKVKLRGRASNYFGVGTTITVASSDGAKEAKFVGIGDSLYSQNSLTKTFGLGKQTTPVTIEVKWPSGIIQTIRNIPVDTVKIIQEQQ